MVYPMFHAIVSLALLVLLINATPLSPRANLNVGISLKNATGVVRDRFWYQQPGGPEDIMSTLLAIPLQENGSVTFDKQYFTVDLQRHDWDAGLRELVVCKLDGQQDDLTVRVEIELQDDNENYLKTCGPTRGLTLTCRGILTGDVRDCEGLLVAVNTGSRPAVIPTDLARLGTNINVGISLKEATTGAAVGGRFYFRCRGMTDVRNSTLLALPLQADGSVTPDNQFEVTLGREDELEQFMCELGGRQNDLNMWVEIVLQNDKETYLNTCGPTHGLTLTCKRVASGVIRDCASIGAGDSTSAAPFVGTVQLPVIVQFHSPEGATPDFGLRFPSSSAGHPEPFPKFLNTLEADGSVPAGTNFTVNININGTEPTLITCRMEGKLTAGAKSPEFTFFDGKQYLSRCAPGIEGIIVTCGGVLGGPEPDCTGR